MAFSKPLYPQPQGISGANDPTPDVSIADDADKTENEDGSVTLNLAEQDEPLKGKADLKHDDNLVNHISESELRVFASDLMEDVKQDKSSRNEWEKTYKEGLKLLGLNVEERTEPWEGACGIVHPVLAEAVVRFQAELITETFPAAGPVKTKILGVITPQKEEAAERVRDDLNIEITDRMTEYRNEHERLLWNLPIAGSALKKVYFDPTLGRQTSMFVSAEDFIVSYGASDLASCARYTHVMRYTKNDLKKLMVSGFYRDVDLDDPVSNTDTITAEKDKIAGHTPLTNDSHYTLYEINVDADIPGFEDKLGIALPYVITVVESTGDVLAVRRNYDENDEQRKKKQHFVHYTYIPGFGFYGFGLIHLVGGFAEGATSILRQLVDCGTLSNLPGGFKSRGMRVVGEDTPIGPGEWRDVDILSGTLKENLIPLPYKEPSIVLAGLLDKIVEEGRKFAAVAEMSVTDFDSNSPVGTTMALLERTLKVMSAVQARIYEAMKLEFRLIAGIIKTQGADAYLYDPATGDKSMRRADYELVDVMPVADPNAATMSQRIVQWQAVMQLAAMAPQIYDLPELHGQMLDILGVKNIDKLIPGRKDNQEALDPVSENMAIMNGKPVKAFITQDHKSHIAAHQAAMQDPKIMAVVGQNPMAQQIMAAGMAHVMEHVAFEYRNQIEQQMGTTLPPPDQPLPPQAEVHLSALIAQAATQLLGQNKNEAAQQAAQQQAQDPVLMQQQADTKVKQSEVDRKAARDKEDIRIEEERIALDREKLKSSQTEAGVKIGVDVGKHHDQMAQQSGNTESQAQQAGFGHVVAAVSQHSKQSHEAKMAVLNTAHEHLLQKDGNEHDRNLAGQQAADALALENAKPKPTKGKK